MNEAIREKLGDLNGRTMRHLGASRRELFERLDRPALRPLPASRFEMAEWKSCGVSIDYHIEVDHNYYSVPYQLRGERVEARSTASTVEIFFKSPAASPRTCVWRAGAATAPCPSTCRPPTARMPSGPPRG